MAEYKEVIKQFKRMCWKYQRELKCDDCPMYPSCNIGQCRKIAFERPAEFERRVMAWAAENPEPKYPTWQEYLEQNHIVEVDHMPRATSTTSNSTTYIQRVMTMARFYMPIPADIAEKLGIEPKEDT